MFTLHVRAFPNHGHEASKAKRAWSLTFLAAELVVSHVQLQLNSWIHDVHVLHLQHINECSEYITVVRNCRA